MAHVCWCNQVQFVGEIRYSLLVKSGTGLSTRGYSRHMSVVVITNFVTVTAQVCWYNY